jgi:hypothetical protein
MLPPVLEIYVVWHPDDAVGAQVCDEFLEHFHGSACSGLIGGTIEVYARNAGWRSGNDAPRPIPFATGTLPGNTQAAQFVAVVPVLDNEFAATVENEAAPWRAYAEAIVLARTADLARIGVFPLVINGGATNGTVLGNIFASVQRIAANPLDEGETPKSVRCRDLAQGVAQMLAQAAPHRLTAFISHTKRHSPGERESVEALLLRYGMPLAAQDLLTSLMQTTCSRGGIGKQSCATRRRRARCLP